MAAPADSRARLRAGGALLAVLALALAAERAHWFGRLRAAAAPERLWIWTSDPARRTEPLAFLAARDFEISAMPASARLSVIGDPEYVVWINGERIGSGEYAAGAPFDVFEVAPRLRSGRNRVMLDLRSATGSGAFSLRIEDERGRALVASDDGWFVYRREWPGLLRGDELHPSERAVVLGASPLGRWGSPPLGPLKPSFLDAFDPRRVLGAVSYRQGETGTWRRFRPHRRRGPELGGRVEFDFGRPVRGYLHLRAETKRPRAGLVRFRERPDGDGRWQPDAIAVTIPRRGYWQDPTPRSFRYVEVVGLEEVNWAAVMPVTAAAWAALGAPPVTSGLLGIRPDPVRVPVVDEIWKRWETAPPVAGEAGAELRSDGGERSRARPRERASRRRPGKN